MDYVIMQRLATEPGMPIVRPVGPFSTLEAAEEWKKEREARDEEILVTPSVYIYIAEPLYAPAEVEETMRVGAEA